MFACPIHLPKRVITVTSVLRHLHVSCHSALWILSGVPVTTKKRKQFHITNKRWELARTQGELIREAFSVLRLFSSTSATLMNKSDTWWRLDQFPAKTLPDLWEHGFHSLLPTTVRILSVRENTASSWTTENWWFPEVNLTLSLMLITVVAVTYINWALVVTVRVLNTLHTIPTEIIKDITRIIPMPQRRKLKLKEVWKPAQSKWESHVSQTPPLNCHATQPLQQISSSASPPST